LIVVNVNPTLRWFFEFIRSLLDEKSSRKIVILETTEGLKDLINEKCLPVEYGGKMEMKDIIDPLIKMCQDKREVHLKLQQLSLNLDLYPKCVKEYTMSSLSCTIDEIINNKTDAQFCEFDEEVQGSFKKLEID
jgi:hypothetical protein